MSTPGTPRSGAAQPGARGSDRRTGGDGRLDPVRWRRPGRGTLLRLAAVAALLVTAATALWSHPQACTGSVLSPPPGATGTPPPGPTGTPPRGATGTPLPGAADTPPPGGPGTPPLPGAAGTPPTGPGDPPVVPSGRVGVPVRLADPAALALVRPGNHVDLLRVDNPAGGARVAAAALVLKVAGADDPTTGGLLLALTQPEAERAVATSGHGFAVLIRPD